MPDITTDLRRPVRPVLRDGVVTLRDFCDDDADAVTVACRDAETIRWTSVPFPYSDDEALAFLSTRDAAWQRGESYGFAIDDGAGYAGQVALRPGPGARADVAVLLHPRARRRGVASRAVRLLLTWGFAEFDLEAVHWRNAVGDWCGRRVAWSTGFRLEGTVSRFLPGRDGVARDCWIATVRRHDALEPSQPWFEAPVVLDPGGLVVLRGHRGDDAGRMAQGCSDDVTRRWLPTLPVPYTEHDTHRHMADIRDDHAAGRTLYWVIADPGNDRLLGEIAINGLGPGGSPEVGYWTHPDARGRGVATVALRLAARHAFVPADEGGLGLTRLAVRAATGNLASQAVATRAGFRRWGVEREVFTRPDGTTVDDVRFDLLAREFGATSLRGTP